MEERRVPLQIFGPKALYHWLFHEWENLGNTSRNALRLQAHTTLSSATDEEQLRKLATAFEYERILAALIDEDFKQFIEWALNAEPEELGLEGWSRLGIPLSLNDLDIEYQELRQLLILKFARERIWPRQGFRPLIQEALDAANQATDALAFADPNMHLLKRWEAIRRVHDGLDRALLCVERFLDLLLEFLALLVLDQGWAQIDEVAKWLASIKVRVPESEYPEQDKVEKWERELGTWGKKRLILGNEIVGKLKEGFKSAPEDWGLLWENLYHLVESCGFEKEDDKWHPTGKLMVILDNLRELRNIIRHAPSTLQESQRIPEDYIKATPKIRENLQKLWQMVNEKPIIPEIAKILSNSSDCYGGTNLTLALETRRVVTICYVHSMDREALAKKAEEGNLALAQKEYEFFLFPPPGREAHLLINHLLLRRDYTYRELGALNIREEVVASIKARIESIEAVPAEESISVRET